MKYIDEYRHPHQVQRLADLINQQASANRRYNVMEVCGTHTAAICRFGIRNLIASNIRLISGPGCPVCVTSDGYLKNAISLLRKGSVLLATYGDMLRVPVDGDSLEKQRAAGAPIHSVISALEAVALSRRYPDKEVVFLAVGFETTAPGTALAIQLASREKIRNFSVYNSHKTIPQALVALGADETLKLDGFLLPGHVSTIIGLKGYQPALRQLKIASVISGFEAIDILLSLLKIIQAVNGGHFILENEYARIVTSQGNLKAQRLLREIFKPADGFWRGLGVIKGTALALRKKFASFDAVRRFGLKDEARVSSRAMGCRCADVLKGKIEPLRCPFFAKKCTPRMPCGPCMVSREGSCRSYFEYRRA